MNIRNRTAVVTGAASGIGRALALELHARGARLVLADRDAQALEQTARDVDGQAVVTDVASPGDNEHLAAIAGAATLVCLNAGIVSTTTAPPWEAAAEEWRRLLDINLGGVVNGLRAFVPLLLADGEPHHILITASLAGLATWPGGGPYAATKHAVVAVAEQTALTLADTPVSVTLLCPALVRTGMSDAGADPSAVATEALAGVEEGRFVVVPPEWSAAIVDRGRDLACGRRPQVPVPNERPAAG